MYKCKLYDKKPNILELKVEIRKYQANEYYKAKKNVTTFFFPKFYNPVDYIFTDKYQLLLIQTMIKKN